MDPARESAFVGYEKAVNSSHHRRTSRMLVLSLMGIVVGIVGGLVAEGLLRAINFIFQHLFLRPGDIRQPASEPGASPSLDPSITRCGWAAGGFADSLFFSRDQGDGIPEAMSVALNNRSIVKPRVSFFKPLSAAITVGSGGPFGAEGPIIQTGAALGSLLSGVMSSSPAERRILLACGAAAGLAGVFKTPFAGVMLAVELLVFEFRARSFVPIALASATGTMVAMGFRGALPVFPVITTYQFHPLEVALLCGFGCSLCRARVADDQGSLYL